MNEVIKILQKWQLEANSGHNDGWTQKHYQDKIDEVKDYLHRDTADVSEIERHRGLEIGPDGTVKEIL